MQTNKSWSIPIRKSPGQPLQDLSGGERCIFLRLYLGRCRWPWATGPAPVIAPKIWVTGATNGHNTRTQEHGVMKKMLFSFVVRLPPR